MRGLIILKRLSQKMNAVKSHLGRLKAGLRRFSRNAFQPKSRHISRYPARFCDCKDNNDNYQLLNDAVNLARKSFSYGAYSYTKFSDESLTSMQMDLE